MVLGESTESGVSGAASIINRRSLVFGISLCLAGLAIVIFCLVPLFAPYAAPQSLFSDPLQEQFFFDLIGWVGGCWLFTWVCSLNAWARLARVGQWLGIILLCLCQAILLGLWVSFSQPDNSVPGGFWLTLAFFQAFFLGYFLGFFTLPSLTAQGNRTLTGLGTLAVLLPWLLGREAILVGSQFLCGLSLSLFS